jgi:hypothetical protein
MVPEGILAEFEAAHLGDLPLPTALWLHVDFNSMTISYNFFA